MSQESSSYSPSSSASSSPKKITGGLKRDNQSEILAELQDLQKDISSVAKKISYHARKSSECMEDLADLRKKEEALLRQVDLSGHVHSKRIQRKEHRHSIFDEYQGGSTGSLAERFDEYAKRDLQREFGSGSVASSSLYGK
jgi:septal ring factor EnvC (AmiA/AmiB activator)